MLFFSLSDWTFMILNDLHLCCMKQLFHTDSAIRVQISPLPTLTLSCHHNSKPIAKQKIPVMWFLSFNRNKHTLSYFVAHIYILASFISLS